MSEKKSRFFKTPSTPSGRTALRLTGVFVLAMVVFYTTVFSGFQDIERGTAAFIALTAVRVLIIGTAAICAVLGGVIGLRAVAAKGERSFLVLLSIIIGAFVVVFVAGELLFPH